MNSPTMIQFESSTRCNARCTMCPRSTMKREQGDMSRELLEKILREAKELGVRHILPFLNGEPLAFPDFWYFMERIRDEGFTTTIFTNGFLLTEENINNFKLYNNIDQIFISFHGGTKEAYERVMGLHMETTIDRVKQLIKECPHQNIHVIMSQFEDNRGTAAAFHKLWGKHASETHLWNWAGDREFQSTKTDLLLSMKPCGRLMNHITIFWDGRVALCCMDIEGRVILGNANTESLGEIWNRAETLRQEYMKGDFSNLPLCPKCNMGRF